MLNAKAYYAVSALDHRYNQSPLSPVCVLTKPDVIPPTSPVITGYEVSAEGITLSWVCSPEPDVKRHILYRKAHDTPEIAFVSYDTLTRYCDTAVAPQTLYRYYMEAVDSAGLHSPASPVVAVRSAARTDGVRTVDKLTVKTVKAKQCITLTWTHHIAGVKTFLIYRAVGDEMLTLWKSADGNALSITDDAPQMHKKHRYAIRPVLPDGSYGEMLSKEVKYN
jgi:fibronectin type 3 domain-containing protein